MLVSYLKIHNKSAHQQMNDFSMYLEVGFNHIADWRGIDHILFLAALCLRYQFSDWKKLLILVTAFTIGHSITLALSVFSFIDVPGDWIEFLIPITIVITAVSNLFVKKFSFSTRFPAIYFFALFFGCIHGLGFSNYLKSLLGETMAVLPRLLAFNVGLEIGQILIVLCILIISLIAVHLFRCNRREYILYFSGVISALALQMAIERASFLIH
ncbi:MAG: HupE/UreJ family protein [Sediminibacterium sp.]